MKIAKFTYKKDDEITNRRVLVFNETDYIDGLDLSLMSEAEAKTVTDAVEKMYTELKPYIKYYRKFLKNKIQSDVLSEPFKSH